MKKIYNIIIISTLLLIFLVGCGPSGGNNVIEVSELKNVTVKILLPGDYNPRGYDDVIEEINYQLKASNRPYKVEFTFLSETDYHQRLPLRINDGYDAAFVHSDNFDYYLSQNILRDAKPYLEEYGQVLLDNTPSFSWKQVTRNDKIYAIPRNAPLSDNQATLAIRKDWMEEYNLDKVETLQELELYFAHTYNKVSETETEFDYVYTADNHFEFLYREYAPSFYFPLINYAARPLYIDLANKEDGKYVVKSYYESEEFIDFITKTRTYFRPLNYVPESTPSNTGALFNANMLGAVWNTLLKTSERIDEFMKVQIGSFNNPNAGIYDVYLNPNEPRYLVTGTENMMALLSKGSNPNETVDFLNWIRSSQDNHDLVSYGIKDLNYELDENGRIDFSNIRNDKRYADTMPYWAFNDYRFVRFSVYLSEEYIESRINWDNSPNLVITDLVGFSVDLSGLEIQTLYSNVKAVEAIPVANMIDGRLDYLEIVNNKTRYERLIDDLNDAGLQRLIELIQQQLDNYLEQ